MLSLQVILSAGRNQVRAGEKVHKMDDAGLHLMLSSVPTLELRDAGHCYGFMVADLQAVHREMQHLLVAPPAQAILLNTPYHVAAGDNLLAVIMQLGTIDRAAMLHFVCSLCLAVDASLCASLLRRAVAADSDLFDFIYRHRLESWPVQRYADALGLSLRKFNQLFKEKYGVSAKHWLLTQRLEHARELLQTTPKKVIDVAFESGFCNHAHFSDSFRRHFQVSPSDVRREQGMAAVSLPLLTF